MAVVITSQFYQAAAWKNISKVVFTSPNIDSPAVAGTRSHILPGEGNLGLWYEDTSSLYRIEDHQEETETDFYNYKMKCKDTIELMDHVGYIDVKEANYKALDVFIKETAGVEIIGYTDSTYLIVDTKIRLEYTITDINVNEIFMGTDVRVEELIETKKLNNKSDAANNDANAKNQFSYWSSYSYDYGGDFSRTYYKYTLYKDRGWYTPVNTDVAPYITFTFSNPVKITAMNISSIRINTELWQHPQASLFSDVNWQYAQYSQWYSPQDQWARMSNIANNTYLTDGTVTTTTTNKVYFIGNFNVQASNDQVTWTTIYTGANTTNLTKLMYFNNTQYYTYYRLNVLNNTGLNTTTFDNSYYGVSKLKFYTYEYSLDSSSDFTTLYAFNGLSDPKILKISNATPIIDTTPEEETIITNHSIQGLLTETVISGGVTLVSGIYNTVYYSSYNVNVKSSTDPYDYLTIATCVSTTFGGDGTSSTGKTYVKQDKINTTVNSTVERLNKGQINEYLLFTSTGTSSTTIDSADWVGLADITYSTVASGTVTSGTPFVNMVGVTERKYDSSMYSRRASFRLAIGDYVTTTGTIEKDADLCIWGSPISNRVPDINCQNSILFEVTNGEAYNCRLTAWDDVTHSTTLNELIQGDHVRCSAMAYCCTSSKLSPLESKNPISLVYPPSHNRIFKGNTIDGGNKFFYGDFDLVYRFESAIYGDFLLFKPMLYGIDSSISYGVHDYILTLHYSYT